MRLLLVIPVLFLSGIASAADAVEAASSCVVIHGKRDAGAEKKTSCFENVALERSSFESGVCQWKTERQAATDVETTTQFVPFCPASFSAFCDQLVLGPGVVVPVKIFVYDRSKKVLDRAEKQCLSGGAKWTVNDKVAD